MSIYGYAWIYIFIWSGYFGSQETSFTDNQNAPAKVTLRFSFSKFSQDLPNDNYQFNLCIDKNKEKCFWSVNLNLLLIEDPFKEISHKFFINNMDANLSISIKMENGGKVINFSTKVINLKKISSKDSYEIQSLNLENFIKLTVEHECENGYYPPNQCTKFCYPIPEEYSCDDFGNKICQDGLYFNGKDEKCLPNNCIKSSIRCYNNGICVNKGSTFECKCLESYMGKFCEKTNPCFPNPCYNSGKCFINQSSKSYFCSCSTGFFGKQCQLKHYKSCICPLNMRCNYSESDELFSCTKDNDESALDDKRFTGKFSEIFKKDPSLIRSTDNIKNQNWKNVSFTTTVVAAVGCLMIIISIAVSAYVCHRTRYYTSLKKKVVHENSPSTQYTQFSPKFGGSTFKRSLSLEDNSAYLTGSPTILNGTPGLLTLGSSNGFSINSNSYQENPAISFVNCPTYSDLCKQDLRSGFLVINRNCTELSNTDTISSGSGHLPPNLPPRQIHETESPTLPNQIPE